MPGLASCFSLWLTEALKGGYRTVQVPCVKIHMPGKFGLSESVSGSCRLTEHG